MWGTDVHNNLQTLLSQESLHDTCMELMQRTLVNVSQVFSIWETSKLVVHEVHNTWHRDDFELYMIEISKMQEYQVQANTNTMEASESQDKLH